MDYNNDFFQGENSERLNFQNANSAGNQFQGQFQNNVSNQYQNQFQNNVGSQFQEQFQNNMNSFNNYEQGNMMGNYYNNSVEPKKQKRGVKIALLVLLILIIFATLGVFASTVFKSDEDRFFDLLISKQSIFEFSNELLEKRNKNEQTNTTLKVDVDEIMEKFDSDMDEELDIEVNMENITKDQNGFGLIGLNINDDNLITLEYAQTGDIYGIKIKEMTEKFIAIENKDLHDLFEKFGVYDTSEIPDKFLTEEDYKEVMKMTETDYLKIANKYKKILNKSIDGKVVIDNDAKLTIDDDEISTKKYTLELTEKAVYNILLAMLETLKDDRENIKMFLNDMEAVSELMAENGYQEEIEFPTVDEVCEALEEAYEELKEEDIEDLDDEEFIFEISAYEYKGKNIATEIVVAEEGSFILKCMIDENVFISFEAEDESRELAVKFILEGANSKEELELTGKIVVKDGITIKVELFTLEQKVVKKAKKDIVKLNEENSLILNDASEEDLEDLIMEIEEWAEKFAEDMEDDFDLGGMNNSYMISQANYAAFAQQFGEFSDQVKIDAATVMAETGKRGKAINNAQKFHMVANGLIDLNEGDKLGAYGYKLPIGYIIPESIQKSLRISEQNLMEPEIVAYLITDNKIRGYENKLNLDFYGDSNGVEQHFITSNGVVFTIPGFAEEQADGSIKYYITSQGHYYTVKGDYNGKEPVDELDPILSRDFSKLHGIDMDGNAGPDVGDTKNKASMYKAGSPYDSVLTPLEKQI